MYKCEYCGRDDFASPGARTSHENNFCTDRPVEEVKSKYDLLAEESVSLDYPGTLFGVPISELIKDSVLMERMRAILVARDENPDDWRGLRVPREF